MADQLAAIDREIQLLEKQLQELRVCLEDFSAQLASRPADSDLMAAIDATEASETQKRRQLDRLRMARAGLVRRDQKVYRAEVLKRMTADAAGVDALGDELDALGASILDKLEEMKPLLTAYDAHSTQRGKLAHSVLKEGYNQPGTFATNGWDRYRRQAFQRDGALALAITATLWQVFGRGVGAELTKLCEIPGPNQCGPFHERADIRETLRGLLQRDRQHLQTGIARAIEVVEGGSA